MYGVQNTRSWLVTIEEPFYSRAEGILIAPLSFSRMGRLSEL